jgi:hypothetical protein
MYADGRLSEAMEDMVRAIVAPAVPMTAIRARMAAPLHAAAERRKPLSRYALVAAAAIAIFFAIFPKASLALFERIVANSYAEVYRIIGFTPPPPPPKMLTRGLNVQTVSLAAAQADVSFGLVPPAGLPADAKLVDIRTEPTLTYSNATKKWTKGMPTVAFRYRRESGAGFVLMAENYDPAAGPPPKYMYEGDDLPGGKVALSKYPHFAWRNGDQLMSVTADAGVTPAEVAAIQTAMHGVPITEVDRPGSGKVTKQYMIQVP